MNKNSFPSLFSLLKFICKKIVFIRKMKLAATFLFLCTLLYQHVESTEDWSAYGIRWAEMPPLGPTHEPTILAKRTNPSETIAKANPKNRRDLLRTYMSLISYMHPFQNNGIALDVKFQSNNLTV
jgi:hypothetical protein